MAVWRVRIAAYDGNYEVQTNSSRIGIRVSREFKGGLGVFAASEWALYLTFSTRLGYLGVRLGKYGELSLGKQWSVYHDISQYADMFIDGGGLNFTHTTMSLRNSG